MESGWSMSEKKADPEAAGDPYRLERFVTAQDSGATYQRALAELRAGRKASHWMWFIFPQVAGLGFSAMAQRYAISGLDEARAYLAHPVLGPRLRECTGVVAATEGSTADRILGPVDAMKLRSSHDALRGRRAAGSGLRRGARAVLRRRARRGHARPALEGAGGSPARPCARPAVAAGVRVAGSSAFVPIAATDALSGDTTVTEAPPADSAATASRSGSSVGMAVSMPIGEITVIRCAPAARSALSVERTPPSMYRLAVDRDRRPDPGHRAARGHRVDQADAGGRVEGGHRPRTAVDRDQLRRPGRPGGRRQPALDHRPPLRLGHRLRVEREPAELPEHVVRRHRPGHDTAGCRRRTSPGRAPPSVPATAGPARPAARTARQDRARRPAGPPPSPRPRCRSPGPRRSRPAPPRPARPAAR